MNAQRGQQVVHIEKLAARQAHYATPSPPLPALLQRALDFMGISQLYTHQVESIERVRDGENIVVVTATSSGKTLCYNLPIIEALLQDRSARALYIYPINALVNDQLKSLFKTNLMLGKEAIGIAKYTGALNSEQRRAVRARDPRILLTNPEMLHLSFLLWHKNWEALWHNLRFIVVDEVHTYRGVFGSNMAHLFRRMLRMAAHYGSSPRFICGSATIANPKELVETLTGCPFSIVDNDGAGSGRKYFVLWNPPLMDDLSEETSGDRSNLRRSYAEESVDLLLHCLRADYNTIVFARARRLTERMLRVSQGLTEESGESHLLERISSYRAGYLAEEREDIENKLKTGDIQGIITTNALEMGIDIGGLDAAIISGYPGTIMSTWQQAGRAGRRERDALIFLVASQNPLDQYYVHHPREFFAQPHELAIVDLNNQHIRLKHLLCSARELPLSLAELSRMPTELGRIVDELRELDLLEPCQGENGQEGLTYPKDRREIHFQVSLRSASQETFRIVDEKRNEIGTIEPPNVFREAHPGAIYQHGGDAYRVIFLDRQRKIVRVRDEQAPHYTRASSTLDLKVESVYASRVLDLGGWPLTVALGDVLVKETVRSYQELRLGSDMMVKRVNLTYPLVIYLHTTAMWIEMSSAMMVSINETSEVSSEDSETAPFAEGLHAVQHLLASVMPLLVMCDRRDVSGFNHPGHPDVGKPAVFVYDAYEGGIGLAEVAYQQAEELLGLAYETVANCRCTSGCPSCIQSGVCRLRNESLDKSAATAILASLIGERNAEMRRGANALRPDRHLLASRRSSSPITSQNLALSRKRVLQDLVERTQRKNWHDLVSSSSGKRPPPEPKFAKGDRVQHSTYGRGIVTASRIEGQREMVTIRFVRRGVIKELDASRGTLRKLN